MSEESLQRVLDEARDLQPEDRLESRDRLDTHRGSARSYAPSEAHPTAVAENDESTPPKAVETA